MFDKSADIAPCLPVASCIEFVVVGVVERADTVKLGADDELVCLSGFRDKKLEKKYQGPVTKECEILVCKSFEKETGKMTKAKSLNVKMVLLEDFE